MYDLHGHDNSMQKAVYEHILFTLDYETGVECVYLNATYSTSKEQRSYGNAKNPG